MASVCPAANQPSNPATNVNDGRPVYRNADGVVPIGFMWQCGVGFFVGWCSPWTLPIFECFPAADASGDEEQPECQQREGTRSRIED